MHSMRLLVMFALEMCRERNALCMLCWATQKAVLEVGSRRMMDEISITDLVRGHCCKWLKMACSGTCL